MAKKKYDTEEEAIEAHKKVCARYYKRNAEKLRKKKSEAYHKAHPDAKYYFRESVIDEKDPLGWGLLTD